ACDLSEVIGTAIALKLLFGLEIRFGVILTALDVLFILAGLDKKNYRFLELLVIILISIIGICFVTELFLVKPSYSEALKGFIPTALIFNDSKALELSLGIIGATVMPHNLYLHSSIVKYRTAKVEESSKMNMRFATLDSMIAL